MSFRIERLWVFVTTDKNDGDEGVIAEQIGGKWFPFVAADERRLEGLKERAREIAHSQGGTIKLIRFDVRSEVETIR